jgi:hypothetical protein
MTFANQSAAVSLEASSALLYGTSAKTLPNYSAHRITWRVWSVTTMAVQCTLKLFSIDLTGYELDIVSNLPSFATRLSGLVNPDIWLLC